MMRMKIVSAGVLGSLILALAFAPKQAAANAIIVTNLALVNTDKANGNVDIQFDLSWSNSWRSVWDGGGASITNWDAAWVFVKYRQTGGDWQHVRLADSGHTPAVGCVIVVGSSGSGTNVGAFIYRSANGYGALSAPATQLRWHYTDNGLTVTNLIEVSVHAIEMVHVPEGAFYVGSGGTESGSFTEGSWVAGATIPFAITNEAALTITNAPGCLWGTSQSGDNTIGDPGELPAAFPKGFKAFYCMKYSITQGQYAEFLNLLTRAQQATRCVATELNKYMSGTAGGHDTPQYRNMVKVSDATSDPNPRIYTAERPDRACTWLSWADGAAYADWSGLRPMTELEFEKACRGPAGPVTNEYAWGTNTIMSNDKTLSGAEDGTETVTTAAGLGGCHYYQATIAGGDGGQGPLRVGIFATNNANRVSAGATYWGIMELNGNLSKRPVSVGHATGRLFEGTHGNGGLASNGNADVPDWPGTDAIGAGTRGGDWYAFAQRAQVSDRFYAASVYADRAGSAGFRATRTAP